MEPQRFEQAYQGQAPWDTGQPQPAIVKLAEAGQIRGSVLDVGCGTGENLLYLAARGHEAWGLDFVPVAIERAKAKAAERGIDAHFIVGNALELKKLKRQFDTVIDCGLFHTFTDEERPVFVRVWPQCLGLEVCCTSSAFQMRSRERRGQGGSASRRSGMPFMTDGRFKGSSRSASRRFRHRKDRSSALVARRHGWLRLNGFDMGGN